MKRAHFNRNNRRSGGSRKVKILIGQKDAPALSIQCFESRHKDCLGDCKPFAPDKCDCSCHTKKEQK